MSEGSPYRQATLDWICCNKYYIQQIASDLGVPAEAIAGFMAKENNSFRNNAGKEVRAEGIAAKLLNWSVEDIQKAF